MVIAGPPGSGKTAFARACVDLSRTVGWDAEVLLSPAAAACTTATGEGLLSSVLDELTARDMTTVLFVDAAERLGEAEAALIYDAAARRRVVVVATLRSETLTASLVTDLWRDGVATRIDLSPLDEDLVSHILATVLDGPVEHATAAMFADLCAGNGCYLHELVLGALSDGTLRESHGLWRLTGEIRPSARLVEIVESELRNLSVEDRRVLETLAYVGSLASAMLWELFDPGRVSELERSGYLLSRRTGDGIEFALRCPVHREVIRSRLSVADLQCIASRPWAQPVVAFDLAGSVRQDAPCARC